MVPTENNPPQALQDALFEHEIFHANQRGSVRHGSNSFRSLESAWAYDLEEILNALADMQKEGLLELVQRGYVSTKAGRIAREHRWQTRGLRHPSLTSKSAALDDILVALTHSGGYENENPNNGTLDVEDISIFLQGADPSDVEGALERLVTKGIIARRSHIMDDGTTIVAVTPEGRRYYAQQVVPKLGLRPPMTILSRVDPARPPFDQLGLPDVLMDNLRYRWEEAQRCEGARAWLAANIIYGSILEVLLQGWLQNKRQQAQASRKAPRGNASNGKAQLVETWHLDDLIAVSLDLGLFDPALERHVTALRRNRNLVHPNQHIKERSNPDANLTAISRQVVLAVVTAATGNA